MLLDLRRQQAIDGVRVDCKNTTYPILYTRAD